VNVSVTGGGISSNQTSGNNWSTSLYNTTTFYITADGQSQQQTVVVGGGGGGNQCQVSSFYASPTSVNSGSSAYLYWSAPNCTSFSITGPGLTGGTYYGNSVTTNPIYYSGTYYLTAYGNGGSASSNTYISVNTIPIYNPNNNYNNGYCQITNFYASPSQVSAGNATMLNWNTQGCYSVSISGGTLLNNNNQGLSGSVTTGAVYGSATYTLTAYGQNGTQQQSTTVTTVPTNIFPITPTYTPPTYTPTQTIIRYITGDSTTPSTGNGSVTVGSSVENMQGSSVIGNNLAGLALWGGGIFPTSLVGILLLILIIMAILVIARKIYRDDRQDQYHGGHH
jgi:hypothetical protein